MPLFGLRQDCRGCVGFGKGWRDWGVGVEVWGFAEVWMGREVGMSRSTLFWGKGRDLFGLSRHVTYICSINHLKHTTMLTIIIASAFKGTKAEFAKSIITCLIIDGFIVLFAIGG